MRLKLLITSLFFIAISTKAQNIEFSTAGFFAIEDSPRSVENMNPAWRFHKGDVESAEEISFDDSSWDVVSLPNGTEYLPLESSGGKNYRGASWYRKHFTLEGDKYSDKRITLYFEGIMGRSKIWVNGEFVTEHFGGYLPIPIDVTDLISLDGENVIAVMSDNSDDPIYPPGKPQNMLDFCYFGGIYRDCWLIATNRLFITDENSSSKVAGGGLIAHYTDISDKNATVNLSLELENRVGKNFRGAIEYRLNDKVVKEVKCLVKDDSRATFTTSFNVAEPKLWSPESPYLYDLTVSIKSTAGEVIDSYIKRLGIRSIEMTPERGLILNGKEYPRKLIGANRHQDFAIIGNALSNNLHWRDAEKLKGAGMEIIRNAHYPQDPAFMDACDALGLFVISNTPGWQFWNEEPIFEQRVYNDIRQMVRRDRNRPSIIMWEPILNETWYPEDFALNVHNIVKEEYPFAPNYTASDKDARGSEYLDLKFTHPKNGDTFYKLKEGEKEEIYFTREFGDNVDDWSSHNSPSRVAIEWGEIPQLIQAKGYAKPDYPYTSIDALYRTDRSHIGGTLWHSFDHQRGYHPDPFYGGIMTAFRRPKLSYYMFQSQAIWKGPMVYIANIMSPFSPNDVTVYSNCEEVRLYTKCGDSIRVYHRPEIDLIGGEGMPSPIITFKDAFNVMKDKELTYARKHEESYLYAEGYRDGKVVVTDKVTPSRCPTQLKIVIDTLSAQPIADGGDQVVVVAQITDDLGVVKRLINEWVRFTVEGEATIIGDESICANPTPIKWGEAPIILQTTTKAGKVTIKAEILHHGDHTAKSATAEFETLPASHNLIYDNEELRSKRSSPSIATKRKDSLSDNEKENLSIILPRL